MSTPPPRRRDAIERAHAIERAATDLVLAHGYDAVTVDMICERAGVSPRTFFNHFETKEAALLGVEPPTIDERAAREFIVSRGPLLAEAARLIRVDPGPSAGEPAELIRRIQAVGSSPALMARQLDRIERLAAELREVILLRLRSQYPDEDESDLSAQASLITHLVAGLMRFIGHRWAEQAADGISPDLDPGALSAVLGRAIDKLA